MAVFDVSIYEPISPVVTADALVPTADALAPTADGGLLIGATESADALVNGAFIYVEVVEPVSSPATADTTLYTADNTIWPTADGGILTGARDTTDAEVVPAAAVGEPGGGYYPRPRPRLVEGYCYAVLPALEGEAIGSVAVAGDGRGRIPELRGAAEGTTGVSGRSVGRLVMHAAARGNRGQIGAADSVLKGLSVASTGAISVQGAGIGVIAALDATAIGQCDDDEGAVIAILLAA